MIANYPALSAELKSSAYTGMSDQEAADALNAPGTPVQGVIAPDPLLTWCGANGIIPALQVAAAAASPIQGAAQAAMLMLQRGSPLDTSNANVVAMIGGFVAAGVITSAQQASLLALGQTPGSTRAEIIFGVSVGVNDVTAARAM